MALDLDWLAKVCGASRARRAERVQELWSGYGEIVRVTLEGADVPSVVVKAVNPPRRRPGAADDVSHARKVRSYGIEATWYSRYATRCDESCRVPKLIASRCVTEDPSWLFVLEDLDAAGFGGRTRRPNERDLEACLAWLASFHARFVGVAPDGLWSEGTYWHLATRRAELAGIADAEIRARAPELDHMLADCTYRTLVHGDAKPANFCFAKNGSVAAVDFQYVGGGCGMRDVAYVLDGERAATTRRLLDRYFVHLGRELARARTAAPASNASHAVDPRALEAEWRALYPVAAADFHRFLAGWGRG